MKKIILSVAILSMSFAYAQEKEVKAAVDALQTKDFKTAKTQISAADSKLNGNISLLTPEYQEKYLFSKGLMLVMDGKVAEGAEMLGKISDMAKNKIYSGKNSNKDRVYFVGKAAADASGISNLKEESYTPETSSLIGQYVNPILQKVSQEAVDAYNSDKFNVAGAKFKEVYFLLKAAGQDNEQYLYNSAISYGLAKDLKNANEIFTMLIDSGYTGVETTYTAKNKTTGEVFNFEKPMWDMTKKDPNFSDFKSETSKSIESDLYDAAVKIQVEDKKYDQALATIEKGLKKFPDNVFLLQQRGDVFNLTGKTSEYVASLKKQLESNPKDAIAWYNLGVMQSKDEATKAAAKTAYLKAIELDPTMKNAYQNLTFLEMGDDTKAIEEYEALKKTGNMDAANNILKKRKERFALALPYAEKWYKNDPTNANAISLLKIFYQTGGNSEKFQEFKAKEDALSK